MFLYWFYEETFWIEFDIEFILGILECWEKSMENSKVEKVLLGLRLPKNLQENDESSKSRHSFTAKSFTQSQEGFKIVKHLTYL